MATSNNPEKEALAPASFRWTSRGWGVLLLCIYVALVLAPLVLALLHSASSHRGFWGELAKGLALSGFSILALQVVLNSRFRIFEAPFGYDVVTRFHRTMAIVALCMVVAHPLLLSLDMGNWFLLSLSTSWQIYLGKFALLFLLLAVPFALFFRFVGVNYQTWRAMHKGMVAVPVLAFVHAWFVGSDLQNLSVKGFLTVMLLAAALIYLYRNLIHPFAGRYRYTVDDISQVARDVYTLTLKPADGPIKAHAPGQFAFLKLKRPGRKSEEHPFTLPSSPSENPTVRFTIKRSGDFTDTIGETKAGDQAFLEGPLGRYSYVYHDDIPSFLFIAGGVGITPIMSMLRYMTETLDTRRCVFIYANDTEPDIIFRDELDALPDNINVSYVLKEAPENWHGEKGYVSKELIQRHAGELLDTCHVFLCGPPPMMDAVLKSLKELGVEPKRIHYEKFSL